MSSAPSLPLTCIMLHQSTHEHAQIVCSLQRPIFINTIIDIDIDADTAFRLFDNRQCE